MRIGTRGSTLALWQAGWVADRLKDELPGTDVRLVTVITRGDTQHGPLTGGPGEIGFFTSEIEQALLDGRVDLAVHSLKDLPTSENERVPVAAVPLRHDAADVLVAREGWTLDTLPEAATVATSSPRRACFVRSVRPDLRVVPVRGNVDSRVRKVEAGEYDAIVLAAAGLTRLGLDALVSERFDPSACPPAPGQGALGVQARAQGDGSVATLAAALARIDDPEARRTTTAERVCLGELGGGCARPIGAYAEASVGGLRLAAWVGAVDGSRVVRASASGDDPLELGRAVAAELLQSGAGELLR